MHPIIYLCILFMATMPLRAQEKPSFARRVWQVFNNWDTTYVRPNAYTYTLMTEGSLWHEDYRFANDDGTQMMYFSPRESYKIGPYIGLGPLFVGMSLDTEGLKKNRTEWSFNFSSSIVGGDLYWRKGNNSFRMYNLQGLGKDLKDREWHLNDAFSVDIRGVNLYYVFNNKRFSYPAAYSQSTQQLRSIGSLIAGLSYSSHNLKMSSAKLPLEVQQVLPESWQQGMEAQFLDYGVNVGYSYNWVPRQNVLLNLTLAPALTYKQSRLEEEGNEQFGYLRRTMSKLDVDFTARTALVWNTGCWYSGLSWVYHNFNYASNSFRLSSNFGIIRLYAGFNFGRKK